jgi:hypothetical protein
MRVHRRQFVLGPRGVLEGDSWRQLELSASLRLSYCDTLPVSTAADADGTSWCLLGLAYQSDPDRPDPLAEVQRTRTQDVPALATAWSGRWVLIGDGCVHMDACGLLGCFYREAEPGETRELWVSSSPTLLRDLGGVEPGDIAPPVEHACGMHWYPPPRSRYRPVRRLLSSQVLRLDGASDERVGPRPLISPRPDLADYETALAYLARGLRTVLENMGRNGSPIWLSLTAGCDSRVLLAAASHAGIDATTYTFDKPMLLMKRGDRVLPPKLARIAGYNHDLIGRQQFSQDRLDAFEAHTGGHCADLDRDYIAYGQWGTVPSSALVVRGGVFGLGGVYFRKEPFALPRETEDPAGAVARAFGFEGWHPDSFAHEQGISAWLDWVERTPHEGLDWRDRLYHEQRMGGWFSSIEQSLDLVEPEIVNPFNCHDFLSALACIPEEARLGKQHERDLIARLVPALAEVPFNPPDPRLLRQIRWERRLYRKHGSLSRYARRRLGSILSAPFERPVRDQG